MNATERDLIKALRDSIENAHDVHIYSDDDQHPDDCEYCAIVKRADAMLVLPDAADSHARRVKVWVLYTCPEDGDREINLFVDEPAANAAAAAAVAMLTSATSMDDELPEATPENWHDVLEDYRGLHDTGLECYVEETWLNITNAPASPAPADSALLQAARDALSKIVKTADDLNDGEEPDVEDYDDTESASSKGVDRGWWEAAEIARAGLARLCPPAEDSGLAGQDDRACREGWGLFESNERGLEVQADSDSPIFCRNGISYDHEALAYVQQQADAGSEYHKAAVARVKADQDRYETAARAEGWTRGGDNGGFIFHKPTWGNWKAAASWAGTSNAPKGGDDRTGIYDSWKECCDQEDIEVPADTTDIPEAGEDFFAKAKLVLPKDPAAG